MIFKNIANTFDNKKPDRYLKNLKKTVEDILDKKINKNDLNPLSMFIKKLSSEVPMLYGLFSIMFAILLGVGAAFIRRFLSNLRKKYFNRPAK